MPKIHAVRGAQRATAGTILLAMVWIMLAGCTTAWVRFYTDYLEGQSVEEVGYLIPYYGEPKVLAITDLSSDLRALSEQGYVVIGYTSFNGAGANVQGAVTQARRLHAAIVLVSHNADHIS